MRRLNPTRTRTAAAAWVVVLGACDPNVGSPDAGIDADLVTASEAGQDVGLRDAPGTDAADAWWCSSRDAGSHVSGEINCGGETCSNQATGCCTYQMALSFSTDCRIARCETYETARDSCPTFEGCYWREDCEAGELCCRHVLVDPDDSTMRRRQYLCTPAADRACTDVVCRTDDDCLAPLPFCVTFEAPEGDTYRRCQGESAP